MKKHITETRYPEQCSEYKKLVDKLYKLHLDKNKEYSSNNVKMLGVLGLSLRMMEKIVRLLTLQGWDIWTGKRVDGVKDPKFGSIEQELEDISNLAVIALLLAKDKWGK